jgi:hypothetical protein
LNVAAALLLLCLLLTVSSTNQAIGQEGPGVQAGLLTCDVAAGFGYVIGSSRAMDCTYTSTDGNAQDYQGWLSRIGLDLGYLGEFTLVWAVLAPSASRAVDALAGTYVGVSAQASVGLGGGANVMIGGSRNSITLQPVSANVSSGLYVGGGIAAMELLRPNSNR